MSVTELEQLRIEHAWLRRRALRAGYGRFTPDREEGIPVNAMVEYALGGPEPADAEHPRDMSDVKACFLCRDNAPGHLHARMDYILDKYVQRMDYILHKWYAGASKDGAQS